MLTSDALLIQSDHMREWARSLPEHFTLRAQLFRLADVYTEAAPDYADVPLPGPSHRQVPARVLRAAARELRSFGSADSWGGPELLESMANAQEGRRA